MIKKGSNVSIHYTLTVDGEVMDSSKGSDPLAYVHGEGMLVDGLEEELAGLKKGDKKKVVVVPEKGYGALDPKAFQKLSRNSFPKGMELAVGQMLTANIGGEDKDVHVSEVTPHEVTLNLNHPLAGKTLNFEVEVVDVK